MSRLSSSEARAEAAVIVLHALLRRLPHRERVRLYTLARAEGGEIGSPPIEDEIAWLFRELPQATAAMIARDECS